MSGSDQTPFANSSSLHWCEHPARPLSSRWEETNDSSVGNPVALQWAENFEKSLSESLTNSRMRTSAKPKPAAFAAAKSSVQKPTGRFVVSARAENGEA
jgi:hypothetical protein